MKWSVRSDLNPLKVWWKWFYMWNVNGLTVELYMINQGYKQKLLAFEGFISGWVCKGLRQVDQVKWLWSQILSQLLRSICSFDLFTLPRAYINPATITHCNSILPHLCCCVYSVLILSRASILPLFQKCNFVCDCLNLHMCCVWFRSLCVCEPTQFRAR